MEDKENLEKTSEDDLDYLEQGFDDETNKDIEEQNNGEEPKEKEADLPECDSALALLCQLETEDSSESTKDLLVAIEVYEKSKKYENKHTSDETLLDEAERDVEEFIPEKDEQEALKDYSDESMFLEMLENFGTEVTLEETVPPQSQASEDGKKSSLVDLLEGWLNDWYANGLSWQDVLESNEKSPEEPTESIGTVTGDEADKSAVKSTDSDDPLRDPFLEKWGSSGIGEVYVERKIEVTTRKRSCPEHGDEEVEEISQEETLCLNLDGQDSLESFLPEVEFIDFSECDDE